jgi:predicted nucleic acid-binding protein
MNWLVIDADVATAWLFPHPQSAQAENVLVLALAGSVDLAVPHPWSGEVLDAILGARRAGRIDEEEAAEARRLIDQVPRRSLDHDSPAARDRTWRLATRFDLSVSDASYLEVADRLQCPLLTFREPLDRAAAAIGLRYEAQGRVGAG